MVASPPNPIESDLHLIRRVARMNGLEKTMRKFIKKQLRHFFTKPSAQLARLWPTYLNLSIMRWMYEIQLGVEQLHLIMKAIKSHSRCRFLVFGLGNDSLFWSTINHDGVTIFLEDDQQWFEKVTKTSPTLRAFLVQYGTQRRDWKKLLESQSSLEMALPKEVEKTGWDVVLVDAPAGWGDQTPGRMKSIYAASRLVKKTGDIFVHDCEREVEDAYCNYFLKDENLKVAVAHPEGWLRHYCVFNRSVSCT